MTANIFFSPQGPSRPARDQRQSFSHFGLLVIIGFLLAFLFTSCTSEKPSDPISIYQAATDRVNKGDVDGAMKFYADTAVISYAETRSHGAQEIREYMENVLLPSQWRTELSNPNLEGNELTVTVKIYQGDQFIETGEFLVVFEGGLIIFEGTKEFLRYECDQNPSQTFCQEN